MCKRSIRSSSILRACQVKLCLECSNATFSCKANHHKIMVKKDSVFSLSLRFSGTND